MALRELFMLGISVIPREFLMLGLVVLMAFTRSYNCGKDEEINSKKQSVPRVTMS